MDVLEWCSACAASEYFKEDELLEAFRFFWNQHPDRKQTIQVENPTNNTGNTIRVTFFLQSEVGEG